MHTQTDSAENAVKKHHPSFNSAQTVHTQTDGAENVLEPPSAHSHKGVPEKAKTMPFQGRIRGQRTGPIVADAIYIYISISIFISRQTRYRYLYIDIYIASDSKWISRPLDIYDIYRYVSRGQVPR